MRAAEVAADEGDGASEQEPEGVDDEAEYAHVFEDDEQSVWSEQEGEIRLSMFVELAGKPCFAASFSESEPVEQQESCEIVDLNFPELDGKLDSCAREQFECEKFGASHVLSESELLALELLSLQNVVCIVKGH